MLVDFGKVMENNSQICEVISYDIFLITSYTLYNQQKQTRLFLNLSLHLHIKSVIITNDDFYTKNAVLFYSVKQAFLYFLKEVSSKWLNAQSVIKLDKQDTE